MDTYNDERVVRQLSQEHMKFHKRMNTEPEKLRENWMIMVKSKFDILNKSGFI